MKKRYKIKVWVLIFLVLSLVSYFIITSLNKEKLVYMKDLSNYTVKEVKDYAMTNKLALQLEYEYSKVVAKDKIIKQNILENTLLQDHDELIVTVSLGEVPLSLFKEHNVDELGVIPVMMYHGIINLNNADTEHTKGNVDKDGFNRTKEAFKNDLEMYYSNGYRMIRLQDYIDGNIKVELGKSPIVLTFDDGNVNNMKVLGKDSEGNLIIDPNSAVGILEAIKEKYPDFNVTATFFLNISLFGQSEYNNDILNWLVDHGYDIGNHTSNHYLLSSLTPIDVTKEIASIYQLFDSIIPNKYVNIIALPHGSPTNRNHNNFPYILNGTYNDYTYVTESTLRVGWEPEKSPYDSDFDRTFIKRVRAWDNNGSEDIEMTFNRLQKTRYISSGNDDIIVIPKVKLAKINKDIVKEVITYE